MKQQLGLKQGKLRKTSYDKSKRWLKFKYLFLFRAKGGTAMAAKGFSIGLAIEMFTLPTFGLAAVLILPLVYFFRASLPGALIGFFFGKLIYPLFFFINLKVGHMIIPKHFLNNIQIQPGWLDMAIHKGMFLIVGGMVVGAVLGLLAYLPIKLLLDFYTAKRKEKRKRRKVQLMPPSSE